MTMAMYNLRWTIYNGDTAIYTQIGNYCDHRELTPFQRTSTSRRVVAPWGRVLVVGTAKKKEGKRRHAQTRSCTATGPCRSFSKKQFRESGSSWLVQSPSWRRGRFDWALPSSDHSSCHRRLRDRRLRSNSSFALEYVARTRTFILKSHFRLNHFCQVLFTIFWSSCVLIIQDGPPAVSTTATMIVHRELNVLHSGKQAGETKS